MTRDAPRAMSIQHLTATADVLNTVELLEMVLCRTYKAEYKAYGTRPAMTNLLLRQQVNTRWRDVIQCSGRLRQLLWLRHGRKQLPNDTFNPILDAYHDNMLAPAQAMFTWSCFANAITATFNRHLVIDVGDRQLRDLDKIVPREQGWAKMLLWRSSDFSEIRPRIEVKVFHRIGGKSCWQEHTIFMQSSMTARQFMEEVVRSCKGKPNVFTNEPYGRREEFALSARRLQRKVYAWKQKWTNRLDESWRDLACEVVAKICVTDHK